MSHTGKGRPHAEARRERMAELERQMREANSRKVQGRRVATAERLAREERKS